jgi:hypothetical protein
MTPGPPGAPGICCGGCGGGGGELLSPPFYGGFFKLKIEIQIGKSGERWLYSLKSVGNTDFMEDDDSSG